MMEAQKSENARLREALELIAKGEMQVFDNEVKDMVYVSMCDYEMQQIARRALKGPA